MQVNPKIVMKTTLKILLTALTALTCFSSTTLADVVVWQGGVDTDFDTANNWQHRPDGGTNFRAVPATDSNVRVGDYHTPSRQPVLSSNTDYVVTGLDVGFGTNGFGNLTIESGSIEVTNAFNIGQFNNASGVVNLSGGELKLAKVNHFIGGSSGTGTLNLSSGSLTGTTGSQVRFYLGSNAGGTGNLNITGGTINDQSVRLLMNTGGTANFSLTGSTASVSFNDWYMGNGTTNINLTADASGISLLNSSFWQDQGGTQNLVVDLTNYDIVNGTSMDIIDVGFASFDETIFESVTVLGGTADFAYTADGSGTLVSLNNISVVPEPSTYALIAGMMGLVAVMLRRR